jgi:hypothetical protein
MSRSEERTAELRWLRGRALAIWLQMAGDLADRHLVSILPIHRAETGNKSGTIFLFCFHILLFAISLSIQSGLFVNIRY